MIFTIFQTIWDLGYSWSNPKPRLLMDYRPLVEGRIANFGIFLDVFEFLQFTWFFPFFKKFKFLGILDPTYWGIGAIIRIGQEILCLPYAGFFTYYFFLFLRNQCNNLLEKILERRHQERVSLRCLQVWLICSKLKSGLLWFLGRESSTIF